MNRLAEKNTFRLFRLDGAVKRSPQVEAWMHGHASVLGEIAKHWFQVMRDCGGDVRELLHDGQPTACVGDLAFAYVDCFRDHVNVGFFSGSSLPDPAGLLEGSGKFMRHVKLRTTAQPADAELKNLIKAAYAEVKRQAEARTSDGKQ